MPTAEKENQTTITGWPKKVSHYQIS